MTVYELLNDRYYDDENNGDTLVNPFKFAFMVAVLNNAR